MVCPPVAIPPPVGVSRQTLAGLEVSVQVLPVDKGVKERLMLLGSVLLARIVESLLLVVLVLLALSALARVLVNE